MVDADLGRATRRTRLDHDRDRQRQSTLVDRQVDLELADPASAADRRRDVAGDRLAHLEPCLAVGQEGDHGGRTLDPADGRVFDGDIGRLESPAARIDQRRDRFEPGHDRSLSVVGGPGRRYGLRLAERCRSLMRKRVDVLGCTAMGYWTSTQSRQTGQSKTAAPTAGACRRARSGVIPDHLGSVHRSKIGPHPAVRRHRPLGRPRRLAHQRSSLPPAATHRRHA